MEATHKKCRRRSLRNLRRSSSSYVIPARVLLDPSTEDGLFCDRIVHSPYGSAWLGENTMEKLGVITSSNSTNVNIVTELNSDVAKSRVTDKINSIFPTDQCNESFITDRSFKGMLPSPSPSSPLCTTSLSYQVNEFKDLVEKNEKLEWKPPISFQGLFSENMDTGSECKGLKARKSIEKLRCSAKSTSPKAKKSLSHSRVHGSQLFSSKGPTSKTTPSSIKSSTARVKMYGNSTLNMNTNFTLFNTLTTNIPSFQKSKGEIANNKSRKTETDCSRSSLVSNTSTLNFSSNIRLHANLCRPSTSQSETGLTESKAAENAIFQLSSKLQALQTGMVKNRKVTSESKQDREESILPKKLRRKSEAPDIKRCNELKSCSKANSEHSLLIVDKSKKRKQLSLRKSLPAVMVPNTNVDMEKLISPSSNISTPARMTSETTVMDVPGENNNSVKRNMEINIDNQIPCNELCANQLNGASARSDNGYISGTCDNVDFEMTEELLKSFDLPVFNENLTMGPDSNSEKKRNKKDKLKSLRRSSRFFSLYEMPLSRPSLEAQSEVDELSNQNSSSSMTFDSPGHIAESNAFYPENLSLLNKYTSNKENVPSEETDTSPQNYQTLFSNEIPTSFDIDKITIEEMTEDFNSLFVDGVTRSKKIKDMNAKTNQRRKSTNVFKACSENIMYDIDFHNDNVIPQNSDKTKHILSDFVEHNSLVSDVGIIQDNVRVSLNNGSQFISEEKYITGNNGNQNMNAVGDLVIQDIAGSETFCDLKPKEDMDTSEESLPRFTKVLRSRKSWDLSQAPAQQENKVTSRKHKISETFTPTTSQNTGHLDRIASPSNPSNDKSKDDISPGLKDLYLNKNVVLPKPKTWETIKENPTSDRSIFTKQKFKRILLFEAGVTASKLQQRHKKATLLSKRSTTKVPISDQDFEKKLLDLDLELMLDC